MIVTLFFSFLFYDLEAIYVFRDLIIIPLPIITISHDSPPPSFSILFLYILIFITQTHILFISVLLSVRIFQNIKDIRMYNSSSFSHTLRINGYNSCCFDQIHAESITFPSNYSLPKSWTSVLIVQFLFLLPFSFHLSTHIWNITYFPIHGIIIIRIDWFILFIHYPPSLILTSFPLSHYSDNNIIIIIITPSI